MSEPLVKSEAFLISFDGNLHAKR